MRLRPRTAIAIGGAALAMAIALGAPGPSPTSVTFRRLADQQSFLMKIFLRFGFPVANAAKDYPSAFAGTFDGIECSATLVGPNALLTSGHCVHTVANYGVKINVRIHDKDVEVECDMLTSTGATDVGMCKLTTALESGEFEVLSRDAALVGVGRTVRLTGWADSPTSVIGRWWMRFKSRLGFGSQFRTGTGTITENMPILLVKGHLGAAGGEVVADPGDSGGAAYAEDGHKRWIVGVNHCGGAGCGASATESTTGAVSVTHPDVEKWIADWAKNKPATVCGYNTTTHCRP